MGGMVGAQIGDERLWLVPLGGPATALPALVSASGWLDRGEEAVRYLFAGDEVLALRIESVLIYEWPRTFGYVVGEPAAAEEVLRALFARGLQHLPLAESPPLALALPTAVQGTHAELVRRAAEEAGWGPVTLVTDHLALAAAWSARQPDFAGLLLALVPGKFEIDFGLYQLSHAARELLLCGRWNRACIAARMGALLDRVGASGTLTVVTGGDMVHTWAGTLAQTLGARGQTAVHLEPEAVAAGALLVAGEQPPCKTDVATTASLCFGLLRPDGLQVLVPDMAAPGPYIRALRLLPEGGDLHMVAAFHQRADQAVPVLVAAGLPGSHEPYLLELALTDRLTGGIRLSAPGGAAVLSHSFSLRLP